MPTYLYRNPETNQVVEVVQGMNDKHVFFKDGIEYIREFTSPKASVDTKIDPYSSKDFVNKTSNKKGKLGDLWDLSNECASKRGNGDKINQDAVERYKKVRNGREPLHVKRQKAKETLATHGVEIDFS